MKRNGLFTRNKLSRRYLLKAGALGAASLVAAYYWPRYLKNKIKIITESNSKRGHILREKLPVDISPVKNIDVNTLIVGAGVSGLSAAYFLEKRNFKDYLILEADSKIGGNSSASQNDVSKFPNGAHYLPIIRNDDPLLLSFLQEFGIVTGFKDNLPIYKDEYLCHAPDERLFIKGRWQQSLIPSFSLSAVEQQQFRDFFEYTHSLQNKKGRDGKYLFSIPVDQSSQDVDWLKLDQISFTDFLNQKSWLNPALNWYVNYCCRDDFGIDANLTSAWAGLHYFSSRNGKAANAEPQSVLTWPEGNAFLVDCLISKISRSIKTECTVRSVSKTKKGYEVLFVDNEMKVQKISCKKIIYAVPQTVVAHIQPELNIEVGSQFNPWVLINLKVKKSVLENNSYLAWDNVRFGSDSLGYINSSHQLLSAESEFVNITFYHAFSSALAKEERAKLWKKTKEELLQIALEDIGKMHANFSSYVEEAHIKILGHGMVGPRVNYIWKDRNKIYDRDNSSIIMAHTERAGISIFEEAFHQGQQAAEKILRG